MVFGIIPECRSAFLKNVRFGFAGIPTHQPRRTPGPLRLTIELNRARSLAAASRSASGVEGLRGALRENAPDMLGSLCNRKAGSLKESIAAPTVPPQPERQPPARALTLNSQFANF